MRKTANNECDRLTAVRLDVSMRSFNIHINGGRMRLCQLKNSRESTWAENSADKQIRMPFRAFENRRCDETELRLVISEESTNAVPSTNTRYISSSSAELVEIVETEIVTEFQLTVWAHFHFICIICTPIGLLHHSLLIGDYDAFSIHIST